IPNRPERNERAPRGVRRPGQEGQSNRRVGALICEQAGAPIRKPRGHSERLGCRECRDDECGVHDLACGCERVRTVSDGKLTVVGVGIKVPAHVTTEVRLSIEGSDEVLYLVADPVAASWIRKTNPRARPMHLLYEPGEDRRLAYAAMVEEILALVRRGGHVCV